MSGKSDKVKIDSYDRYEFRGVKIAHELMVDILGGLIPGALFLFSIILCIVFPIICYADPNNNNFGFLVKDGDWFWIVAFLSFLILSYVIGHIFYRADIKEPDRMDIRREQKKKLMTFIDGMPVGKGQAIKRLKYAASLLYGEVKPLSDALKEYETLVPSYDLNFQSLRDKCEKTVDQLRKLINESEPSVKVHLRENILCVLFPEAISVFNDSDNNQVNDDFESYYPNNKRRSMYYRIARRLFPEIDKLPFRSRSVIINAVRIVPLVDNHTGWVGSRIWRKLRLVFRLSLINRNSCFEHLRLYKSKWDVSGDNTGKDSTTEESFNILMVAYLILHMQNESGCATEKRCDFPYMSYYKYLLKRRQFSLLKYADWVTSSSRTKNRINKYKIELQLHVPDAFSIINKNESHIRMASSSWHVAKTIKRISLCMIAITGVLAIFAGIYHTNVDIIPKNSSKDVNAVVSCCLYPQSKTETASKATSSTTSAFKVKDDGKPQPAWIIRLVYLINTHLPFIARETVTNCYLAVMFPIFSLLMAMYILQNVPRFIHYQRLREIFYTLKVYKLWEDLLKERREKERQDLNIRRAEVNLPPIDYGEND